jgi:hypothetical protein
VAGLDLGDRVVECGAPSRAWSERDLGLLVRVEEGLSEPGLGTSCRFD